MQTFSYALWLTIALFFQQAAQPPLPLIRENATVKVSEHVYVIPDFSVGAVPNVGIVVGSKGTLVTLDIPRRYSPTAGAGTALGKILNRLTLHLSIGQAY